MPIVNGRHHMNPARGRLIEVNRIADGFRGLAAQAQPDRVHDC